MKNPLNLLILFLLCAAALSAQQPITKAEAPDDSYDIQDPVLIKTRDGASISASVVRKKGNTQKLPAILVYTTYDEGERGLIFGKRAVDKGYVGIVAYSRGIRTNLNDYMPFENDARDAHDVIDWINRQQWCDGKVGMYAGSYTGAVQWATAAKNLHPALKTIVPQVAVMPGFDFPMENNVHPAALSILWANNILKNKPLPGDIYNKWYEAGVSFRSFDSFAGQPNRIFQKWLEHPSYDDYWKSLAPTPKEYSNLNIPILTTTGYYDGSQISALEYVKLHYKYHKNPNHYFVIGPYHHFGGQGNPELNLMGYAIDPVANVSMRGLAFEWFDYILKGGKKPALLKDKINYEVMGANEWRHAPSLEKISNRTLVYYLSDSGRGENHLLSPQKPEKAGFLNQTVDFKDRVNQNNYFTSNIINESLDASNGLVFMTEPFNEAFSINGSFSGQINASINKRDMDVSMAFYELMPDGKYFYLTRYLGRASYAGDNSKRQLLRPGKKETIPLAETRMVSKQISKGSRLVIVLNVNKHPFEVINYGTGKDVNDETIADAKDPLQVKWYNSSYIKIPIWK
ncbi:MAG TPA: CocE/NonD family hydrolase [Pyrinomonadaceae bacterium]|jgi:hypothetical protein